MIRFLLIIIIFFVCLTSVTLGQSGCLTVVGAVYGSPNGNERAKCLLPTAAGDGIYAIGMKEDSALIVKLTLEGIIVWSRTLDIVPGEVDHVTSAILDGEGMIVVNGIGGDYTDGGSLFAFRYNPNSNQLLWAQEYVNITMRNYAWAITQRSNGNYIMTGQPHDPVPAGAGDDELFELSKANGSVVPGSDHYFHLGGSNDLSEVVSDQNFIYGTGRYTDNGGLDKMRNTIVKYDPVAHTQVWVRLGHIASGGTARIYGRDLVIDQGFIWSVMLGDPAGTSLTNTKIYVQKTDLDGNLVWLKQYDLPGTNDWLYQLIPSGSGFVILGAKNNAPTQLMMFKINNSGSVLWAKQFVLPSIISSFQIDRGNSQLIQAGGYLFVTATGVGTNGKTDMLIIRTDLNGNTDQLCMSTQDITISVIAVANPVFYAVTPTAFSYNEMSSSESSDVVETNFAPRSECVEADTLMSIVQAEICQGESYEGYTMTGVYEDLFTTPDGCDSIRTLDLQVNNANMTNQSIQLCLGEMYEGYTETGFYTDVFQNIHGCDSIRHLNLTVTPLYTDLDVDICEGQNYDGYEDSGFYVDTLQGPANACDTIRNLNLFVHPPQSYLIEVTICAGESYEGYSQSGVYVDDFMNVFGCDSIRELDLTVAAPDETSENVILCAGESYQGHTQTGVYENTYTNSLGCDSTHTIDLEVRDLDETNLDISICEGSIYEGYAVTGLYTDIFINEFGCDSIRNLNLTVSQEITNQINATICTGDSYMGYTNAGVYVDTVQTAQGCDSIRSLTLTVLDVVVTDTVALICHGQSLDGFTATGTYADTLTSVFGCDSIHNLHLTVEYPLSNLAIDLCAGGQFEGHTQAGIYVDTLIGIPGQCDTIRMLTLTIAAPLLTYINAEICEGQSFLGYDQSGMFTDTFQSAAGCDSVRTLDLTVASQIETTEHKSICPGDIYQGYSMTGMYLDTFTSTFGCDSIRILELDVAMPEIFEDVSICEGSTYSGYSQSGVYDDVLTGQLQECDTLRHLTLTVTSLLETTIVQSICEGQVFEGYSSSGSYIDTFQTSEGCDSVRILELLVSNMIISNVNASICPGQFYEGYDQSGFYVDTFASVFGCDSLRQLTLDVIAPEQHLVIQICSGQSFGIYTETGIYQDTLYGVSGACDTLVELSLTVLPATTTQVDQTICEGESYQGYSEPGDFIDTLSTVSGCDSIRELHLERIDAVTNVSRNSICDQVLTNYSQPGVYTDTFVSYRGCDSIQQYIIDEAQIYIPNVFSPNSDGINDVFTVIPFPATELTIHYFGIFDRFGDMAYETNTWPIEWKGVDHEGKIYQPAVFGYVLIYECAAQHQVQHGNITLLR